MSSTAQSNAFAVPKIQNILFATDLSTCSDQALPVAIGLARQFSSTVHVLHVIPPEPMVIGEYGVPLADLDATYATAAQLKLKQLCDSQCFEGVLYTQTVQIGAVWDIVNDCVRNQHIDLIVMGTHGRRGLKHLVLGSVAEQVFRRATCPVLTVGPEANSEDASTGRVQHILYATDFSQASLLALPYALMLARSFKAHLTLLHAVDRRESEFSDFDAISNSKTRLSKLMPADSDVHYSLATDVKPVTEMIIDASKALRRPADLIVMGAHHGSGPSAHAPWATAHKIMCLAPCPVLTVCG